MGAKAVMNTTDTLIGSQNKLNYVNAQSLGASGIKDGVYSDATLDLTQQSLDKIYASAKKVRTSYTGMMANVSKTMTLAGGAFGNNIDNAIRFQEIMAEAYAVGGCVRDSILGTEPLDWDITTSALPEEVSEIFRDFKVIPTGIKHGTVTVIISSMHLEITTYRIDGKYEDNRHPVQVTFSRNITEDLSRRDFTINAMAYNPQTGFFDPFRGLDDLNRKIIKAVGIPEKRFSEDALRIMRALRFAAVLGFGIEENTAEAIFRNMHLLSNVSAERIYIEWRKLLSGEFSYGILQDFSSLFEKIIPTVSPLTLPGKERFKSADYITRMLSLFALSSENPSTAFTLAADRLRMDNATRSLGCAVLSSIGKIDLSNDKGITYALKNIGETATAELIRLEILLAKADAEALVHLDSLLSRGVVYRISDLSIDGNDLLTIGARGKEIGAILDFLLNEVVEGRIKNEHSSLLSAAQKILVTKTK